MEAKKFVKTETLDSRDVAVRGVAPADPRTAATLSDRAHFPTHLPWHTPAVEAEACDRAEPLLPSGVSQSQALAITLSLGFAPAPS